MKYLLSPLALDCRPRAPAWHSMLLVVSLLWPACCAEAQTVTFDFDTGTPALMTGQNVPLDQTSSGVTVHFSSPQGAAYSIQTDSSTGNRMSQFSGHYLYPNNLQVNTLDMTFSLGVTNVSFTFATTDFPPIEIPSLLQLTAYQDSTGTVLVGSVTARAAYGNDTMPMGVLTFNSPTPFSLATVTMAPGQPSSGSLLDNITIQLAAIPPPRLDILQTGTNAIVLSWPTSAGGYVLQENPVLGTTNWANTTNAVNVVGDQNQVIISPLTGSGFFRLFHP